MGLRNTRLGILVVSFALLMIASPILAGEIPLGGYCFSECADGVSICAYNNAGGSCGSLIGQVYPVGLATATQRVTPTPAPTATPPQPTPTPYLCVENGFPPCPVTPTVSTTPTASATPVAKMIGKKLQSLTVNGVVWKCGPPTPVGKLKSWTCSPT